MRSRVGLIFEFFDAAEALRVLATLPVYRGQQSASSRADPAEPATLLRR